MELKKSVLSFIEFINENYSYITEQKIDIEGLIVEWWKDHPKLTVSTKSLAYWEGGEDKTAPNRYHNRVVNNLESIVKAGKEKNIIPKIIEELKKLSENGVYITFKGFEQDPILNALSKSNGGTGVWDNPQLKKDWEKLISDYPKILENIKKGKDREGNPLTVSYTELTPEIKKKLIEKIENRVNQRVKALTNQGKKNYTQEKAIKEAKSILVAPKKEAQNIIKEEMTPTTEGELETCEITYPNTEKPMDTKMLNFFGDNEYKVKDEDKKEFARLIKENIDEIINSGGKIEKIEYSAGAITSRVRTKYSGNGQTNNDPSEENNELLVKDRLKEINGTLSELLNPYASQLGSKIVKVEDESKPNMGPGWMKYDTSGDKFEYGPLYLAERNKNKELTPRDFYSKRDNNPQIQKEYDEVFGKFRGSYGKFFIVASFSGKEDEPGEEKLIGEGEWIAKISWKINKNTDIRIKTGNAGGGKSYPGGPVKTECWKF
jgi:hypothetical protein